MISIPGNAHQPTPAFRFRLNGRLFFRLLTWAAGCTLVLWLFILHSGDEPLLNVHNPFPAVGGGPHLPFLGPTDKPPSEGEPLPKGPKWWPGNAKPAGAGPPTPPKKLPTIWDERAKQVKAAFVHAYTGYLKHAGGYDELLPVVGGKVNNFNGWGVTIYDGLDTMWIMGLHDEFRQALSLIAQNRFYQKPVSSSAGDFAPFFETTIRYLGGLLSAYALSKEPTLLARADDLGKLLLPVFNTTSGLPMFAVNTVNGQTKMGWSASVLWAEAMSNQMEYKYLAHLTGREEYYNATERIVKMMEKNAAFDGLFASKWNLEQGIPNNEQYTVGAYADSAYEYLLKQWLLTGRSEPRVLKLYISSANGIIKNLLHITDKRNLLYVTDANANGTALEPTHTLEHLSCFLPGLFALGVKTLPSNIFDENDKELHLWAAEGLAETCWATYADTKSGLGPDVILMKPFGTAGDQSSSRWVDHVDQWQNRGKPGGRPPGTLDAVPEPDPTKREWTAVKSTYLLRPETIESFYVLWKTTGNAKWRERGWTVFQAIEKHAKTKYGYASISTVDSVPVQWKDEMPSYFMAETLKYLYLLFAEEDPVPFEKWVFNTEAHPLPIFEWTSWEKKAYGIDKMD
ncbi:mannosyl-oligosaccharide alpha-1,2-mannosidase [Coprinopsis marcescibilis]|uniref:alpha-1,2-Mannosidase n=1 Tax=Coprinopsis marcescibilis TaxID=230819 RepID=A0A5C3L223_COPMA|nr:mannosyl-oligosaccharide alpha-1,2-mannosidase [Coprinopsis marcescibilis]